MKYLSLSKTGRWLLLVLMLGLLAAVPDAMAQSRERDRGRSKTDRKERVERKRGRTSKARRQGSRKGNVEKQRARRSRTERSRSSQRTRSANRSGSKEMARTPRSQRNDRVRTNRRSRNSRSTETSRSRSSRSDDNARTSRSRRSNDRVRSGRSQRSNDRVRTGRSRQRDTKARSGRSQRSNDRVRNGRSRRGDDNARTSRSRRSNDRVRSGRSSRVENRGRTGRSRVERGRRAEQRNDRTYRNRRPAHRDGRRRVQRRTPRYHKRDAWHQRYQRDRRYHKKHWNRRRHRPHRRYAPIVIRPFIDIDIRWPWVHRHRHGWRPRYRYRQVVYVEAGWGQRRHTAQIDVRTYYTHQLRYATEDRAEVDIYVDEIEFYQNGRYLGTVRHVPDRLARIRATVYRNGDVRFDRDVFVVGDARTGFELISTRHYDGFLYDHYRPAHGLRIGQVDLRRQRVVPTSYSRLFDPYDFNGYVPVSLLPENSGWLLDYGRASYSADYYDEDPYYYGGYDGYDGYEDTYYGDDYYEEDYYVDDAGRPYFSVRSTVADGNFSVAAKTQAYDRTHHTAFGAEIRLKRETEFVRVK